MAIDPLISGYQPVTLPQGVAERLMDLNRRLAGLEARRGVVGAGTITGGSGGHIASGTISASNILAGSITASLINAGAINATHIQAGSIDTIHLLASSVTTDKLAANSITAEKIAVGAIVAGNIQAGAIQAVHIAANAITATKIAADSIDATHIKALSVNATHIAAATITGDKIASNSLTSTLIQAGAIGTTHLQADSVTATQIAADAVTALKIDVTNLASISTDMGNLTAGTITGGTIQSGTSGSRWVGDATGIRGYASDGTTVNFEFNTGSGIATVKGIIIADAGSAIPITYFTGDIGGGNLARNSGFENTTLFSTSHSTGGTGVAISLETTTTRNFTSAQACRVTNTDVAAQNVNVNNNVTGQRAAGLEGKKYINSAWVFTPVAQDIRIYIYGYSAANANLGSTTSTVNVPANVWTRIFTPVFTLPAGSTQVRYTVEGVLLPAGGYFIVDDVQIEAGDKATAYAPKVNELLPSTILGPELAANSVTTTKMTAGTINADRLTSGSIQTLQIAAGAITASTIAAGAIQADKLSVSSPTVVSVRNGSFNEPQGVAAVPPGWTKSGTGTITTPTDARFGTVMQIDSAASDTFARQDIQMPVGRHVWRTWVLVTAYTSGTMYNFASAVGGGGATLSATNPTQNAVTPDWILMENVLTVTVPGLIRLHHRVNGTGTVQFANSHLLTSVTTTEITPGAITTSHITTNTLDGGVIQAGTLSATKITAGSITADRLNVGIQGFVIKNGNFQEGTTTLPQWSTTGTVTATSTTDTTWGKVANIVTTSAGLSKLYQDIVMPPGEHVVSAYVKTTSIVATLGGVALTAAKQSGSGSVAVTGVTTLTGTNDWTRQIIRVSVTTAVATVRLSIGVPGTDNITSGTFQVANVVANTPGTNTTILPNSIDSFTITGATFQTAAVNPRIIIDAQSIRHLDAAGVPDFYIPTDPTETAIFRGAINADGGIVQPVDANNLIGPGNKYSWLNPDGASEVASIGTSLASGANAYTGLINASSARDYWKFEEASGNFAPTKGALTMTASGTLTYAQSPLIANEASSKSVLFGGGKGMFTPSGVSGPISGLGIGTALNAYVENGQTWATSGATTDFVGGTGPLRNHAQRSTTADASARIALFGSTTFTDVETSMTFLMPNFNTSDPAGQSAYMGMVTRYVNSTNYAWCALKVTVALGQFSMTIIFGKVVAGVATTISTTDAVGANIQEGSYYHMKCSVTAAGAMTARLETITNTEPGFPKTGASAYLVTASATGGTDLATGGALASGRVGLYDQSNMATGTARGYMNFAALVTAQRFDSPNWSFEAWVKPTNVMTDGIEHVIAEQRGNLPNNAFNPGEAWKIAHVNGAIRVWHRLPEGASASGSAWGTAQADTSTGSSFTMAQNSTYHIAVVVSNPVYNASTFNYDGGYIKIYVNGVERQGLTGNSLFNRPHARVSLSTSYAGFYGGGRGIFQIGDKTTYSASGAAFTGNIDEAAFYPDYLLTQSKAASRYSTGSAAGAPETKLTSTVQAPGGTLRQAVVLDDRGYGTLGAASYVSSIPATGVYEGMEIYLAVGTIGAGNEIWHLKYLTDGGGWCYLGGGPMRSSSTTSGNTTQTVITSGAVGGTLITVPYTGSYFVTFYAEVSHSAAGGQVVMGYTPNAAAGAANATEAIRGVVTSVAASQVNTLSAKGGPVSLTAGNILSTVMRAGSAGTVTHGYRWIEIYPKVIPAL